MEARSTGTGNITISHCREDTFHNRFRGDLGTASRHVLILSPFLSQNRALSYYPAMQVLRAQGVAIEVYARPRYEQPSTLLDHYDVVKGRLVSLGIVFHERPGMHEKIGVIDDHILWHGSLNILSHNDSRESMLRFESPDLVEEILVDLGLQSGGGAVKMAEWPTEVEQREDVSPHCPICQGMMKRYPDIGLWICQNSPTCTGSQAIETTGGELLSSKRELLPVDCPICGEPLQVERGLVRRVRCSRSSCEFSLDPRISTGILRIVRRASAS
jgi:PLD-like domain